MYPAEEYPQLSQAQKRRLNNTVTSANIEGMELDADAISRLVRTMTGTITSDEARDEIVRKYGLRG